VIPNLPKRIVNGSPREIFEESCNLCEDAIFVLNRNQEIIYINPAATKIATVQLNSSVTQLRGYLEFRLKDNENWVPMESLISIHRSKNNVKKSVF